VYVCLRERAVDKMCLLYMSLASHPSSFESRDRERERERGGERERERETERERERERERDRETKMFFGPDPFGIP